MADLVRADHDYSWALEELRRLGHLPPAHIEGEVVGKWVFADLHDTVRSDRA
jgi:hypothetical protein